MRTLEQLPKGERVVIPAIYNSDRKATVRCTLGAPHIIHISIDDDPRRPYDLVEDHYLHLRTDNINADLHIDLEAPYIGYRRREAERMVEMIRGINTHYFAKQLTVLSDSKAITDRVIPRKRTAKELWMEIKQAWDIENELYIDNILRERSATLLQKIKIRWGKIIAACKPQTETIEALAPLADAHLGGSWQRYYAAEQNWMKEAQQIANHPIYLA